MTPEQFAEIAVSAVKDYVSKELAPINEALAALKSAPVFTPEEARAQIEQLTAEHVKSLPAPADGKDGKDATLDLVAVAKMINAAVTEQIDTLDLPKGEKGDVGAAGRDAVEINILPSIEFGTKYAFGTYAHHRGGLWKYHGPATDLKGWECVMDGLAEVSVDYDGERGVEIRIERAAGEPVIKKFSMPMVIDRGVYDHSKTYELNDGVTYAGAFWIAVKDAPEGAPGTSKDFRLAVKRGRDYKEPVKVSK